VAHVHQRCELRACCRDLIHHLAATEEARRLLMAVEQQKLIELNAHEWWWMWLENDSTKYKMI
jgi:hypothetical protein